MTKGAALTPEHAALHARFRTMLSGPFINLHIRRDIEMAEKILESIPAMLEQARAEGREEAAKVADSTRVSPSYAAPTDWDYGAQDACVAIANTIRSLSATRKGSGQ